MISSPSAARPARPLPLQPAAGSVPKPGIHLSPAPAARPPRPSPLALWHLLSLDAPTIAVLWTVFIAASFHLPLPLSTPLAMALAVWTLYAADRLLDTRPLLSSAPLPTSPSRNPAPTIPGLEARHHFHDRHRRRFLLGILIASVALATLLPRLNPDAIHLDLLLGALLFGYFVLIHTTGNPHRLPKEFAVGIFFSAAVFIPTVSRAPGLRLALLLPALLFGALCTLNCLFIYAWEHEGSRHAGTGGGPKPHVTTHLALCYLPSLAAALSLLSLADALAGPHRWLPLAIALASSLLLLLHRSRHHLAPLHLRASADLALLTPLLLLPFLHA